MQSTEYLILHSIMSCREQSILCCRVLSNAEYRVSYIAEYHVMQSTEHLILQSIMSGVKQCRVQSILYCRVSCPAEYRASYVAEYNVLLSTEQDIILCPEYMLQSTENLMLQSTATTHRRQSHRQRRTSRATDFVLDGPSIERPGPCPSHTVGVAATRWVSQPPAPSLVLTSPLFSQ